MNVQVIERNEGVTTGQGGFKDLSGDYYTIVGAVNALGCLVVCGYSTELSLFVTAMMQAPVDVHSFRYFSCVEKGHTWARKNAMSSMLNRAGVANATAS
jgi:hypothetical protein